MLGRISVVENISRNSSCFVLTNDKICYLNDFEEHSNELIIQDFSNTILYKKKLKGNGAYSLYYINTIDSLLILFSDTSAELFELNLMEFFSLSSLNEYQILSRFNESNFYVIEKRNNLSGIANYGIYDLILDKIIFVSSGFDPYFFQQKYLFGGRLSAGKQLVRYNDSGNILWEIDVESFFKPVIKNSNEIGIYTQSIGEWNGLVFFRCNPSYIVGLDISTGKLKYKFNLEEHVGGFKSYKYSQVTILIHEENGNMYFFFYDYYFEVILKNKKCNFEKKYYLSSGAKVEKIIIYEIKNNYMIGIQDGVYRNEKYLVVIDLLSSELMCKTVIGKDVHNLRFFNNYLSVVDVDFKVQIFSLF